MDADDGDDIGKAKDDSEGTAKIIDEEEPRNMTPKESEANYQTDAAFCDIEYAEMHHICVHETENMSRKTGYVDVMREELPGLSKAARHCHVRMGYGYEA